MTTVAVKKGGARTRAPKPVVVPVNRYKAAPGAPYSDKEAQTVGEALEGISRSGLPLTPSTIVEVSKSPAFPLHRYFEWNDAVAAEKHRQQQARLIVNHLQIVVTDERGTERETKAAFSVVVTPKTTDSLYLTTNAPQYVSVQRMRSDADLRGQIQEQAWKELRAWAQKYASLGFTEFEMVYQFVNSR